MCHRPVGRFDEAINAYQTAIDIFRETGDRHREGKALNNLGVAYHNTRQHSRAVACWEEAAAAMREAGDDEQAALLEQFAANAQAGKRPWLRRLFRGRGRGDG